MNDSRSTDASTAEAQSAEQFAELVNALQKRRSFIVEAGAGSGKTYMLVETLKYLLEHGDEFLPRRYQRIACLTYTRVARDELISRTDKNPVVFADTLHGFLWEMISPFRKDLIEELRKREKWNAHFTEASNGGLNWLSFPVEYDLGIRRITSSSIKLHHEDIPVLAAQFFRTNPKFRAIIADKYPVILIDEYQDTPEGLVEAILSGYRESLSSPIVGFFGDHWQQIYDKTCGAITDGSLVLISKTSNFRSDKAIVQFLNRMRPELKQAPSNEAGEGAVTIYHTNHWRRERQRWPRKTQLPENACRDCLEWVTMSSPASQFFSNSKGPKVLMLTHRAIAVEAGYPSLPDVFEYNDSFTKLENPLLHYCVKVVEPALEAYRQKRYGQLFEGIEQRKPRVRSSEEKAKWVNLLDNLEQRCQDGTVKDVVQELLSGGLFALPGWVTDREREVDQKRDSYGEGDTELDTGRLLEYENLLNVRYQEVRNLRGYLEDQTLFSTQHSVKGAEFDDVVVVIGREWSKFDFYDMIASFSPSRDGDGRKSSFEKSRNLFYVASSRARKNLVILFTAELGENAMEVLSNWAGEENLNAIQFDDEGKPYTASQQRTSTSQ